MKFHRTILAAVLAVLLGVSLGWGQAVARDASTGKLHSARVLGSSNTAGSRLVAAVQRGDCLLMGCYVDTSGEASGGTITAADWVAIAATNKSVTVELSAPLSGTDTQTTPVNVVLVFNRGARLDPAVGTKLSVLGDMDAGRYQVFGGAGTVDLSDSLIERVLPQWFGVTGDYWLPDGSLNSSPTDNCALLNAAIVAAGHGRRIYLPAGGYHSSCSVTGFSTGQQLVGEANTGVDSSGTQLIVTAHVPAIIVGDGAADVKDVTLENFVVQADGPAAIWIRPGALQGYIRHVTLIGAAGKSSAAISSITRSSIAGVATDTVITSTPHGFVTGDWVDVAVPLTSMVPGPYTWGWPLIRITRVDATTFTYVDPFGVFSGTWTSASGPATATYRQSGILSADMGTYDWTIEGRTRIVNFATAINVSDFQHLVVGDVTIQSPVDYGIQTARCINCTVTNADIEAASVCNVRMLAAQSGSVSHTYFELGPGSTARDICLEWLPVRGQSQGVAIGPNNNFAASSDLLAVSTISRDAGGLVTVETVSPHALLDGEHTTITTGGTFYASWVQIAYVDATHFTYLQVGLGSESGSGGQVFINTPKYPISTTSESGTLAFGNSYSGYSGTGPVEPGSGSLSGAIVMDQGRQYDGAAHTTLYEATGGNQGSTPLLTLRDRYGTELFGFSPTARTMTCYGVDQATPCIIHSPFNVSSLRFQAGTSAGLYSRISLISNWNGASATGGMVELETAGGKWRLDNVGRWGSDGILYANLGTPSTPATALCTDCTRANPPAGGGTGAYCAWFASAWHCDLSSGAAAPTTPIMTWSVRYNGTLSSGAEWGSFTAVSAITILQADVTLISNTATCTVSPRVLVDVGGSNKATVTLADGTWYQNSGAVAANVAAGAKVQVDTDGGTCTSHPADALITVQYRMQ